jgi:tellurite resistance protein TerC
MWWSQLRAGMVRRSVTLVIVLLSTCGQSSARLQSRRSVQYLEAAATPQAHVEALPILGLIDDETVNRTIDLLVESSQWHGDIFGKAEVRSDRDVGFEVFSSVQKKEWIILAIVVVKLIFVDYFCLSRLKGHKHLTHAAVLGFWIICGIAFNVAVFFRQGTEKGIQWCSGYFLEWLLSMDNLFVFHLIFRVYATPDGLLHKALFVGIVGAVAFRMIFFMALASLLYWVHWFRFVFGALLIYSGFQAALDGDDEVDISNLWAVRFLKKCLNSRLLEKYDLQDHRMFVVEDGKMYATLLVPVVFCLEVTDIIFAVDSVSAKVAQIPDYYIAYSSSVLAMFGLRAMFFLIRDLVDVFDMLKYGLCAILVFIGIELLIEDYVKLPAQVVCTVILSIFLVCIAGSTARAMCKGKEVGTDDNINHNDDEADVAGGS